MGTPWTLWRSILGEMLKVIGVTALVLVLVISFGATIKPLSDGKLLASDALKFILLASVPMLAYALPVAAGFGATLVYFRVAQDNETLAAYAGGISHRRLLAPALACGVGLMAVLMALNEEVIPRFLRQMERMITVDLTRFVAQEIQRGRAVEFNSGRLMIIADQARRVEPTKSSGATDQILLTPFAAIELNEQGQPTSEATAQAASLWLYPAGTIAGMDETQPVVWLRLRNVLVYQEGKGLGGFRDQVDQRWPVPNTFRDNPKFLTWGELSELSGHPERINWVDGARRKLAFALAERRGVEALQRDAKALGQLWMLDERGRPLVLYTSQVTWVNDHWKLWPVAPGGSVGADISRVSVSGDGATTDSITRFFADEAALYYTTPPEQAGGRLDFRLVLTRVRASEAREGAERPSLSLPGVRPADDPAPELLDLPVNELLARAQARIGGTSAPDPVLAEPISNLQTQMLRLSRSVLAKRHERMAMAASCLLTVITGAITALRLTRKLPLTVYLWTFFPALGCLVTISGGQQMTDFSGVPGLWLLWSGAGALLVYAVVLYRGVARH